MLCGPSSAIGPVIAPSRRVCSVSCRPVEEPLDRARGAPRPRRTAPRAPRRGPRSWRSARRRHRSRALHRRPGAAARRARARRPPRSPPGRRSARRCCERLRVRPRIEPRRARRAAPRRAPTCAARRRSSLGRLRRRGCSSSSAHSGAEPAADPGGRLAKLHGHAGLAADARHLRGDDVHHLALEVDHAAAPRQAQPHHDELAQRRSCAGSRRTRRRSTGSRDSPARSPGRCRTRSPALASAHGHAAAPPPRPGTVGGNPPPRVSLSAHPPRHACAGMPAILGDRARSDPLEVARALHVADTRVSPGAARCARSGADAPSRRRRTRVSRTRSPRTRARPRAACVGTWGRSAEA